ncbi:unnamed protein product [Rotaria socialis]|uniref:F-box domain-containing protein n=2 Tax=Rotaria socialis TaxID=392032 RepID=A0A817YIH3_9BILA|nr:unnamed protein product [Rotaria socialis]
MSTFDDLPNEIIICLFEYLKVEDKFHSFFDCNQRLRQLVKRYSIYSRHGLTGDIKRFSTLHSWYKHLNYVDDGNIFYMIPMAGEQARYGFGPCISDYRGIHWHFFTNNPEIIADPRIGEIVSKYPVKLNPCFYPESSNLCRNTSGFKDFTYRHYPAQFANDKMRLMNQDLTSVVNEMNEIDTKHGCLCFTPRKHKRKKVERPIDSKPIIISNTDGKPSETNKNTSTIPQIIDHNEQEKIIANELNQMRKQLVIFQDQIKTINKSFEEGDDIIQQLGNETNQYMYAITTALNKAEQILGRKFVVAQQQQHQQAIARERKQEFDTLNKPT